MSVITLLTDFGLSDAFVGTMKGVILGICPEARIVDLSHEITPQRIEEGAFVLRTAYAYFPEGTVHVAVVDPGVGGTRRALIVETSRHRFVGPDNGIFAHVYAREADLRVVSVTEPRFMLPEISNTFHGRDVFAPVAAHLALGAPVSDFGPEIADYETGTVTKPMAHEGGINGRVLHIDRYGNIITDIGDSLFLEKTRDKRFRIRLADFVLDRVSASYDEVAAGAALAILDSAGLLEIAVNGGNAAEKLGVSTGDRVDVEVE
ncbi:MAG: SAM-dependent chlorinase/fluorinase [Gemmatimonadetes bacterium]|nr:SAM-dependent chlorinase/fluorinase [Gemmatimonadota bacterium]